MGAYTDPKKLQIDGKPYRLADLRSADDRPRAILLLDWDSPSIDPHTAYCFTTMRALQVWLELQSGLEWYRDLAASLKRAMRPMGAGEAARVKRAQVSSVRAATTRFQREARKAGIDFTNSDKALRAIHARDTRYGPIISSAVLYEHCGFAGRPLYLPSGWTYPNLGWFNFDNLASAVINRYGTTTLLDSTQSGDVVQSFFITISSPRGIRSVSCLAGSPFFFNDMASSASVRAY